MTLRFKYIVGLAAVAAGLVSCVKEDFENAANGSYDGIQFNISTVDTDRAFFQEENYPAGYTFGKTGERQQLD